MEGTVKKVLYVNSETFPYLPETEISKIGRFLPQAIQEKGNEIRVFMPRFGCINERKNQLHEVIRLSGMNVVIDEKDHPLIIKVASITEARLQVYFIDNDEYFKRKQVYYSSMDGKFFEDNYERAIFFAKGVLKTVKKLRWAPDVIHCQGWMTHLLPLFLKKEYKNDPIFANSKVVLSLYNDSIDETFSDKFKENVISEGINEEDVKILEEPTSVNLAKLAVQYADGIIHGVEDINSEVAKYCEDLKLPTLEFNKEAMESGSYIDEYNNFYEQF